jgi:hypothetical protein
VRGRWANGLEPRAFTWIIKDRLAASERPGGFARNHRKVRRQEELLWLAGNGFTHVLSLLESPHNLYAYEQARLAYEHLPLGRHDDWTHQLPRIYQTLAKWLDDPRECVLVHHEEFGERLLGVLAGYLIYARPEQFRAGAHAIVAIETITGRQLGAAGREIVAMTLSRGMVAEGGTGTEA